VETLTRNYLDLRNQFQNNVQGGAPRGIGHLGNVLTDQYGGFDMSGEGLANDAMRVLRVPGQGDPARQQEERTNRINAPSTWNKDSENQAIFDDLGVRIDEFRKAAGLPPLNLEQPAPQLPERADTSTRVTSGTGAQQREAANTEAIRQVADPVLRGHASRLAMMISRGTPEKNILDYIGSNLQGRVDPSRISEILRQRRDPKSDVSTWIRQNRNQPYPLDPATYMRAEERGTGAQIMGAVLDSGPGTAATQYVNGAMGGWLPDAAGAVGIMDADTVRAGLEGQRSANPLWALGGDVAGAATAFGAGGSLARGANILQNAPRSRALLGDVAYGASYGAASNPDDRFGGAAAGAVLQGGGGLAGRAAIGGIAGAARGVADPAVQRLRDAGTRMSVGQTVGQSGPLGGAIRAAENASTSIPGVNRLVTARQVEARTDYNVNTWNEALQSVGGNVGRQTGEQAAEVARREVTAAYGRALSGRQFSLDRPMAQALNVQARRLPAILPEFRATIDTVINNQVRPSLVQGDVQSALRFLKEARAGLAGQPGSQSAMRSVAEIERNLVNMVRRQHPQAYPMLRAADQAHRRVSTLETATQAAINNGDTPGMFTPAQVGQASRNNARQFGGRSAAASTRRPFYQSQRDAQRVLPSNIPDSGTGARAVVGAGVLGLGGGLEYFNQPGVGAAAGGLGLLALLNTRGGANLVNGMLARRSQGMQNFGNQLGRQNFNLPRVPQLNFTGPLLGGIGAGTTLNSLYGEQNDLRLPY
jgi:hypothetical protein